MVQVLSDGKFPKKPEYGTLLDICRKDFQNFKEKYNGNVIEFLSQLVMESEGRINRPEVLQIQKQQLETIKNLLDKSDDKSAFTCFFRTFPTCLPHRSR